MVYTTKTEAILSKRRKLRRQVIGETLLDLEARLGEAGLRYKLFGSAVTGNIHPNSDVDIMIMGRRLSSDMRMAADDAVLTCQKKTGVPIDLLFEADYTEKDVEKILAGYI